MPGPINRNAKSVLSEFARFDPSKVKKQATKQNTIQNPDIGDALRGKTKETPAQKRASLEKGFNQIDKNHDGIVSWDEFNAAFSNTKGKSLVEQLDSQVELRKDFLEQFSHGKEYFTKEEYINSDEFKN